MFLSLGACFSNRFAALGQAVWHFCFNRAVFRISVSLGESNMSKIRIGVIGAGMIAQVEHIPNLLRLRDKFDVKAVCDPSAASRQFVRETFAVPVFERPDQLLEMALDAVLIASPDPLHHEQVL